jgi:hypothetical protein
MLATKERKRKDVKLAMKIVQKSTTPVVEEEELARRAHNAAHIKEMFATAKGDPIAGDGKSEIPGRRSAASFSDIVFGGVTKMVGDGVREFSPEDVVLDRTEPDKGGSLDLDSEDARLGSVLASWAGKGTIETPRPAWARDSFLEPTGMYGQAPIKPYAIVEDPGIASPRTPNFLGGGITDGLASPANFDAPRPGAVRAGDGYVLKGERVVKRDDFWSGTSASVALTPAEIEHLAYATGDVEAITAIEKAKRAQGVPTQGFSKARRGGSRFV